MSAMLEVRGLEVNYGHIEAVRGIDLDLNAKEITALVGANGALRRRRHIQTIRDARPGTPAQAPR